MAPAVRAHLLEIIGAARVRSIRRFEIDWRSFEDSVLQAAVGFQTIRDAEPAIVLALSLLNDGHSFYETPDQRRLAVFRTCPITEVHRPELSAQIGYVRVRGCCKGVTPAGFAAEIQQQIRTEDRNGLHGWIVDLRGNTGGNMWPMLAGLTPILGEGVAGYFVEPDGVTRHPWQLTASTVGPPNYIRSFVAESYALRAPSPRVAVLTDAATVSSGEAVVIAFRARPATRSFGQMTCGRSTANEGTPLTNGGTIVLSSVYMADRSGHIYAGPITPDEVHLQGEDAVASAIRWLLEQPS